MVLPKRFWIRKENHVFIYAVVIGIVAGLAAMLFSFLLHLFESFTDSLHLFSQNTGNSFNQKLNFISQHKSSALIVFFLPVLGGLICGLITYLFCKEAEGTGTDEMINAFHNKEGKMNTTIPIFKSIATIFTLSTGGSGGREGPISQIGAGLGVMIANLGGAGARSRRTLMLSGTAAGLGAAFKTPLGGALTAVEMVYKKDIESDALIPCFISSVTAYLVFIAYAGTKPLMQISDKDAAFHFSEIIFYLALGILCYIFGFVFIKGFNDTRRLIDKIKIPLWLKPAIGGLLVGFLALMFFEVSGTSQNYLEHVFSGKLPDFGGRNEVFFIVLSLLCIAVLKIVATACTIGSGGSAGIFGPSLFVGAMLGAAVGITAQYFLPHNHVSIAAFMVVGMGAFYAGVANAPIAGIIMICEMTGSYNLLPPLIIVSIFTFILSRQISFYKFQVDNRFKSPAHIWDMKLDVMESIIIKNYFPEFRLLAMVRDDYGFNQVRDLANYYHSSDFIVVDKDFKYVGVLSMRKVTAAYAKLIKENTTVIEFADKSVPYVSVDNKLSDVLNIIMKYDVDKVAVIEEGRAIGYIRSHDIFEAYNKQTKPAK
ncbi:MAG: chloride channel protein [Bacteroidia bacterium]|nr:chloride channel protein [Bacteroidia bacterium]